MTSTHVKADLFNRLSPVGKECNSLSLHFTVPTSVLVCSFPLLPDSSSGNDYRHFAVLDFNDGYTSHVLDQVATEARTNTASSDSDT